MLLPAFDCSPLLGCQQLTLDGWQALAATPGITTSVLLSLGTGVASTLISLILAFAIVAACHGSRLFRPVEMLLAPLLGIPHAAFAIGLAFLLAPSGWLVRLFSPWLTGWQTPPDFLIPGDPWGLSLIGGLVMKELPFLLIMLVAAIRSHQALDRSLLLGETLGYPRVTVWWRILLPRLYPQLRLPVYAVLAYAVGNVDMALVLGPQTPAPLAPRILQWFQTGPLTTWDRASAAAALQAGLVAAVLIGWRLSERVTGGILRRRIRSSRRPAGHWARAAGRAFAFIMLGCYLLVTAMLLLWALAGSWRFPVLLPEPAGLSRLAEAVMGMGGHVSNTLVIAGGSTVIALIMALVLLENWYRQRRTSLPTLAITALYLPLIVPQIAFLPGIQILLIQQGLDGTRVAVIALHVLFVLPYVLLSLSGAYLAFPRDMRNAAMVLGTSPLGSLWRVQLPLLLPPLLLAAAMGFAVSVSQYLPTLLAGAGRVTTLTTEALARTSGGDRRELAQLALAQLLLPLTVFALALGLPHLQGQRKAIRQISRER